MSPAPPAAYGTMTLIGLPGEVCAGRRQRRCDRHANQQCRSALQRPTACGANEMSVHVVGVNPNLRLAVRHCIIPQTAFAIAIAGRPAIETDERNQDMSNADAGPPNIVFILADNLGWGELGCYGGGALRGAPTPRIDHLASEGLRCLNFNVESDCVPTRSALMTGAIRYAPAHCNRCRRDCRKDSSRGK